MIVMVTGGRDYTDYRTVHDSLVPYNSPDNILVVGGAPGADELARRVWHNDFQLPYIVQPAPWNRHGKPAGVMRNMSMLQGRSLVPHVDADRLIPAVLIAFPGGKGTTHARDYAIALGIEVKEVT